MSFDKTLRASDLAHFTGASYWVRHWLSPAITYTEGVDYVAQTGGAFWLIDAIVAHQLDPEIRALEFQVWTLKVAKNCSAILVCEDGDKTSITTQMIEYTDFPLQEMVFWFQNDVIFLPSEY